MKISDFVSNNDLSNCSMQELEDQIIEFSKLLSCGEKIDDKEMDAYVAINDEIVRRDNA